MAQHVTRTVSDAFSLGVRLSLPFLVIGFVLYAGLGVINRAMPQMMVFFVAAPAFTIIGLVLLAIDAARCSSGPGPAPSTPRCSASSRGRRTRTRPRSARIEATAHKLEQARRRGEVPQSRDVTSLGLYVGLLVALAGFAGAMALDLGAALLPFLEQPDQLLALQTPARADRPDRRREPRRARRHRTPSAAAGARRGPGPDRAAGVRVRWRAPACRNGAACPSIANARQRFGPKGLVEFAKTLLKLLAVTAVVALVIWSSLDQILVLARSDARALGPSLLEMTRADPVAAARVDRGRSRPPTTSGSASTI